MGLRGPKPKPFECKEEVFWYLVGLIAADGCLMERGWLINVTSVDEQYLQTIRRAIGFRGWISKKHNGSGGIAFHWNLKSKILWHRLAEIGLTPRKSLTIGALAVPDAQFNNFLRGVIDGDGNIRRWCHPMNEREQWVVRICGASEPFIRWLQITAERLWCVKGLVYHRQPANERHHTLHTLKYGKLAARVILAKCYVPGSLALERKRDLATACINSSVGWAKSKTVLDRASWKGWKYEHIWKDRVTNLTNPNVDPTSGLVKEAKGFWAGVAKLVSARGLKPCVPKGTCGFDSHPRQRFFHEP